MKKRTLRIAAPLGILIAILALASCDHAYGYMPILCDFEGGRWTKVVGPVESFDIEYDFLKGWKVFDFKIDLSEEGDGVHELEIAGETHADPNGLFSLDASNPETGLPIRIEGRFIAFADCVGSLEYEGETITWTVRSRK